MPDTTIRSVDVSTYEIATDAPESDGTFEWSKTTLVLVEIDVGAARGVGYTYADGATASLVRDTLASSILGHDAMAIESAYAAMVGQVRNLGRAGVASMGISAVDVALWDAKAKALGVPAVTLLGEARSRAPIYGSGGFTSYTNERLAEQLAGWVAAGIPRVKMKVGRDARADRERVRVARKAIGEGAELFVDANGANYACQAIAHAAHFAESRVTWFEEPVSSDDLDGLRLVREHAPDGMDITAGEYGYDPMYFRRMLAAHAVDVLQADATRCGGFTGFLRVAALCDAFGVPLSAHCAPALHLHVACAAPRLRHLEYFHDHVRIESMLFDGVTAPIDGALVPDRARPGIGLEFKRRDAERFAKS